MKLFKPVTIKAKKYNNIEFPGQIFIYTDIEVSYKKLLYKGVCIDSLKSNLFLGYKNSTVSLKVLGSYSLLFYLTALISKKLALISIKKYLAKYKNSDDVDVTFKKLTLGEKLGYIKFHPNSNVDLYSITCAAIVNHLAKHNFNKETYTNCVKSFKLKKHAMAQYTKIS